MNTGLRYRNEYENYPPYKVYFQKRVSCHVIQDNFVVPWQLEDDKKGKEKSRWFFERD
ncbi:hypothetical protein SAMN05444274_10487 [Mariniphaga anaerophila]|uniref:Uncharacterized protein n=1 Tax=Mariniphaga anaerophila TaxID=1484053 RepID=A0A1M4ZVZ3_9BACT|nr:hypothetical protein [Mariniphaga anaerophila]SHF21997.1 hypothetical protein SAMN05444274_10487 [Mariniphaga anaerophila]